MSTHVYPKVSRRARGTWPVPATLFVCLLHLALLSPAAKADTAGTVIPLHKGPQLNVSLIGGSGEGYAVSAGVPYGGGGLFTGAGGELTPKSSPSSTVTGANLEWLGVIGQEAGYVIWLPRTSGTSRAYQLGRVNILTGANTQLGTIDQRPLAFTADGWLSWSGDDLVETRFADGSVNRLGTVPGHEGEEFTSDGALVRSANPSQTEFYLDLLDFGTGTMERVATESELRGFALSPTTIVWNGRWRVGEAQYVKVRARTGGAVVTHEESDDYADSAKKVPGQNAVAYLIPGPTSWKLRVISTSGRVDTVALPDYSDGLIADGDRWLFAASGRVASAGVYEVQSPVVQGSTATQVATLPALDIPYSAVALAGGRVFYADNYYFDDDSTPMGYRGPRAVWSRPVTGLGRPSLGDENELKNRAGYVPGGGDGMSFSAGRGAVSGVVTEQQFTWHLLDRDRRTATVKQSWSYQPTGEMDTREVKVSGPYLAAAGHVYDPSGKKLYSRPGAMTGIGGPGRDDDLYGPRMVYSTRNARTGHSDIWLRDLDRAKSKSNPRKLGSTKVYGPRVAIWGDRVAWQSGNRQITLRRIGVAGERRIALTGSLNDLKMSEGTLAWNRGYQTFTLNTTNASSQPVAYPGGGQQLAVDDHYLARLVAKNQVAVYRNPDTTKYRPRLIGTYAAAGFTPNGDGRADVWSPQFDLSKPVTAVKLIIRSPRTGATLRVLDGTGPDGSIRDLVFDGRNSKDKALANGVYSWELTATALDREGAAIGIRSEKRITGSVSISKVPAS